ncbi:GtrA family protein [Dyella sp. A6]|uniref:GtrA family protein n=1 Tax=Dyella aluminiiresistens TaxID=3069105 RepID=UPI002E7A2BA0|nr:GtrA family protein [Dyella sp. A6]
MKIVRYFFVGGAAAALDFLIFAALTGVVHLSWFWSAIASFTAATLFNYVLSIRFVFKSGARFVRKHHELSAVFLVSSIGLMINQAVLWACIDIASIHPLVSKLIGTGVVFFWNYAARKHFVFKTSLNSHNQV